MAIPAAPERISIKRRRIDEPVNHLLYQSKKQRVIDHVFVRVQQSAISPISQSNGSHRQTSQSIPGIPTIKSSKPGEEISDFYKSKAEQDRQLRLQNSSENNQGSFVKEESAGQNAQQIRQFHLTRDLSTTIRPHSEVQKQKSKLRPHLATFVERLQQKDVSLEHMLVKPPIDRLVGSKNGQSSSGAPDRPPAEKHEIATFQQSREIVDEDTLADELAAMAVEMDDQLDADTKAVFLQEHRSEMEQRSKERAQADVDRMQLDDYVFEVYVRMKKDDMMDWSATTQSQPFGYLVIDEDEEELWQQYLNDENDSDDDWDEEDEDSNAEDNPRNEYPDEELSSDDEYGINSYKYRNYGSDNEQYDEDED